LAELQNVDPKVLDVEKAKERAKYSKAVRKSLEKKIHESEVLLRQREERLQEIKAKKLAAEQELKEKQVKDFLIDF
jgi:RNA polymerase-associated protein CTR9